MKHDKWSYKVIREPVNLGIEYAHEKIEVCLNIQADEGWEFVSPIARSWIDKRADVYWVYRKRI